ncbi:MAG TPA: fibronectin type III domain-containing protein [Candidatus Eisenbacteria bacterium]|nr:fibronectin type III domain-containing protein [Candidatus Eisenbacteria bacterium]
MPNGRTDRISLAMLACLLAGIVATGAPARAQSVDPYHSIGLQWTATGDDSTSGRATAYQLKYSTSDPASGSLDTWWQNATSVPGNSLPAPRNAGATDSTRVAGLSSGTTYFFVIRAVDDAANLSPYSNVATAATAFCATLSSSPSGFAADTIGVSVALTWSGPVDPNATQIRIYRGTGGSGSFTLYQTLTNLGLTSYNDNGVSPGTTYRYRLTYASACNEGPVTSTQTVTLAGTPPAASASGSATLHVFPNPSKPGDAIQVQVDIGGIGSQSVRLRLFDLNGRWVADVADETMAPGRHTISWSRVGRNGNALAPGYYELLGTAGSQRLRERILLLP